MQVDVILMATLLGLLGTLLTLICYTILQRIREHFRTVEYKYDYCSTLALFYTFHSAPRLFYNRSRVIRRKLKQLESEDEREKTRGRRMKNRHTTETSSEATDYVHFDTDSDADAD